ncbi:MAG TPA: M56 family metallopeptidase [Candidatus Acidoferrales bacterium]|nr:M56 family metallopeptidase [Candidatus Acidoferrales bacterium]
MTLPYALRLLCLCFAAFFLIHAALSLLVRFFSPAAIRLSESVRPRLAARVLFFLRLTPFVLTIFAVAAFCIPSYLWFEANAAPEQVGILCVFAAILGLATWLSSISRVASAWFKSRRNLRHWERSSLRRQIGGEDSRVLVVASEAPLLALAGVIRPRIFVANRLLHALPPEQLDAALRHERGHTVSHDNLKRLVLLFAPGILPFFRGSWLLDRSWARFSELAADDFAVAGDSYRSLSLAAALVRAAQLGSSPAISPFASSLLASASDLSERVDRLLGAQRPVRSLHKGTHFFFAGAGLAALILLIAALSRPETFHSVHSLLELLIH